MGFNYNLEQSSKRITQQSSEAAAYRLGDRQRDLARAAIYQPIRCATTVSAYDVNHPAWAETRRRVVEVLCRARVAARRLCLDRLRLSRRADALRLAVHQLPVRHRRHVRLPEGQLLLLQGVVGPGAGPASLPALELGRANGEPVSVWVHTNLDEVELFLNGRSQGRQKVQALEPC